MGMDRLTALLLRLTPEERRELAREVAGQIGDDDDVAIESAWLLALNRHFGEDDPELPLWSSAQPTP
jgi:hypothetical protein